MNPPSITLNAKMLAFVAALYLGYKEVRIVIEKGAERDIQFAWLQKDVETLKMKMLTLKP